jgi:rare lipoprotein A
MPDYWIRLESFFFLRKNNNIALLVIFFAILFLIEGCATSEPPSAPPSAPPSGYPKPYRVYGKWYQPLPNAKGFRQRGLASWYGRDFHGKKTSSGETYDMYAMTAAHKTLPLGTYVRVHHLANNTSVDVRINDRGPFVRGRIIDLSYTAARSLGLVGPGTAEVEIVALGKLTSTDGGTSRTFVPEDYYSGNFTFQIGAFLKYENAERLKHKLNGKYKNAHITTYDNGKDTYYRVRVGKAANLEQAAEFERYLIQNGFPGAFIVAE